MSPLLSFSFERWARAVLRHRLVTCLVLLGATVYLGFQAATNLVVDSSAQGLLANESEAAVTLARLQETFGDDRYIFVVAAGDVFSDAYLNKLRNLHHDLELISMPGEAEPAADLEAEMEFGPTDGDWAGEGAGSPVDEVISLVNVRDARWQGETLRVGGLLDAHPATEEARQTLRARVLGDPGKVGRIVGASGRHSVLMVRTSDLSAAEQVLVHREIYELGDRYRDDAFDLHVAGYPALLVTIDLFLISDIAKVFLFATIGMIGILAIVFRHPAGIVGPVLVIVTSVVWVLGAMAVFGAKITLASNAIPVFIAAVCLGDAIHVQSTYRRQRRRGLDNHDAIVRAVGLTGRAIAFTSLTTAAGLLSFLFASLGSIQQMGLYSALGVAFAFALSLTLVPVGLTFHARGHFGLPETQRLSAVGRIADHARRFALSYADNRARPVAVLVFFATLTAASVFGMTMLRVNHQPLSWFPEDHPIRRAFAVYDENVGGSANVALFIELEGDHRLTQHEVVVAVQELERRVLAYRDPSGATPVTHVTSVLDLIRESWRAVHEGKPEYYVLPDSDAGVAAMFTMIENGEGAPYLDRLVDAGRSKGIMEIRLEWLDATAYLPFGDFVRAAAKEVMGKYGKVHATGGVFASLSVLGALVRDLISTFSVAFAVITVVMILLLRDPRLGLIAMIPNLLPIIWIMGLMGFAGVPLELNTILIGSISLGIVVDDTVHFFHHFAAGREADGTVHGGFEHAFAQTGSAMVVTTLVTVVTFGLLATATLYNLQWFGLLVAATSLLALVADLVMGPALLALTFGGRGTNTGSA